MGDIEILTKAIEKLGKQVEFIRAAKVTELIATGSIDELFLACEKLFGPERAEWLLAKAVKEWHGAKSVEVEVGGPTRRECRVPSVDPLPVRSPNESGTRTT